LRQDTTDDFLWTLILAPIGGVVMMAGLCLAMTSPFLLLVALAEWSGIGAGWVVAAMFPLMLILCGISEKLKSRHPPKKYPWSD
jgi:hypothetical protein